MTAYSISERRRMRQRLNELLGGPITEQVAQRLNEIGITCMAGHQIAALSPGMAEEAKLLAEALGEDLVVKQVDIGLLFDKAVESR